MEVMSSFLNKFYNTVGFSSEILSVVLFLLCFCSPKNSYLILCSIYTNLIPNNYFPLN